MYIKFIWPENSAGITLSLADMASL